MQETSWFNLRAGRARLGEIGNEISELQKELRLLKLLLGGSGAAKRAVGRPAGPRPRSGPTLLALIAEVIATGPRDKTWTAGELTEVLAKRHPGRLPARNPSSLVSATLSQGMHARVPLFVARKANGEKAKLYRLAR